MKKKSFIIFMSVALLLVMTGEAFSQGCVAIRGTGGAACMRPLQNSDSSGWLLNINNRYFESYKHFVGTEEQYEREENGTQVINNTYNMDLFSWSKYSTCKQYPLFSI
jgi:hypothetical protein